MAGKHRNYSNSGANTAAVLAASALVPPVLAGSRHDRAYCLGRQAGIDGANPFTDNPFDTGKPGFDATLKTVWTRGHTAGFSSDTTYAGSEFHTGIPDKA